MGKKVSLYEAKTKLSELVRQVREGGAPVTITVHGQPAVELRAIEAEDTVPTAEVKLEQMRRAGLVHEVAGVPGQQQYPIVARRPGALKRFLDERD